MKSFWKIFIGVVLIAVAAGILLKETGVMQFDFEFWNVALCVVAVVFILYGLFNRGFFCLFGGAAVLYHGLTPILNLPSISVWVLLLVAFIASIGFGMIFPKKKTVTHGDVEHEQKSSVATSNTIEDNGHIDCSNSFGSVVDVVKCTDLKSLHAKNSFGDQTIDFREAIIIDSPANIQVSNSFGKATLRVPAHWDTNVNFVTSFGSAKEIGKTEEKVTTSTTNYKKETSYKSHNTSADTVGPKVNINGSTSFGEILIEYV